MFQLSLSKLHASDNFSYSFNGITHQLWASNELTIANNKDAALNLYSKALKEFNKIDNQFWKNDSIMKLDSAIRTASNNQLNINSLEQ